MRRLIVFLALAALPALAAAQQMPDPRQMSGMPRPDPQVPAGTLTVKVLAGDIGKLAPKGTLVHLVGVRGDGVKLMTARVNDEGRAEFEGLDTEGKTAYYALSLYGQDRLTAQPATLPPRVGVRMMLTGRKLDAAGQPQGPAIDDEQQIHEGVAEAPKLPAPGEVEVVARGRVEAGNRVVVRELASGATRDGKLDGKDGMFTVRIGGLEPGPDKVYVVEIPGSPIFRSTPFMLSPAAGVRRMILAYDQLLFAIEGGAQPEDEVMWFQLSMTVANLSGAPIDTGPEGLMLPLPAGFRSATISDEQPRVSIEDGMGIRYRGPVPPGQLDLTVQFAMDAHDGHVAVAMPAPLGMFQSQIAIAKGPGTVISATALPEAPKANRSDDGREYLVLSNITISPGDTLRFEIAGLPVPEKWQGWVKLLAGLLVVALVGLAIYAAVRRPAAVVGGALRRDPATAEVTRKQLGAKRERLYAELVALERARQGQRIDDVAFAAHRKAIMAKLVLVHRQLDDLDGKSAHPS